MTKITEKKQKDETTLAKADKFFAKKNYAAAKKEFLKVEKTLNCDKIETRIKFCDHEIGLERAKVLCKKAQRLLKKNKLQEACDCFAEAFKLSEQPWIKEKIDQLHEKINTVDKHQEAPQAEAQGDYLKAAELYAQIYQNQPETIFQKKRAHCLVMAEQWQEAVTLYDEIEINNNRDRYDSGLALANIGQYYQCLESWLEITSSDPDFQQQKETVYALLRQDIRERVENSTESDNLNSILRQAAGLLKIDSRPDHQKLFSYCLYSELEKLWQAENYTEIGNRLDELNNLDLSFTEFRKLNVTLIGLRAKASALALGQKPADDKLSHASNFIIYWLTALYFPGAIINDYGKSEKKGNEARKQLCDHGLKLLKTCIDPDTETGKTVIRYWDVNCNLVNDLESLGQLSKTPKETIPISTPLFALNFGEPPILQKTIADNRDFFRDESHYLTNGAWYSPAAQALHHSALEEHDRALEIAVDLNPQDKFTKYALLLINFSCGVCYLHQGEEKTALKQLGHAHELLRIAPDLEKVLIGTIYEVVNDDKLQCYENVFTKIAKQYSSPTLNQALSLVMTRLGINKANAGVITPVTLKTTLQKALRLDSENELARGSLDEAIKSDEIDRIYTAINNFKTNRAAQIAVGSNFTEVRDSFFECLNEMYIGSMELDYDNLEKIEMLRHLYKNAVKVDDKHPLVIQFERELDNLQEQS